MNDDITNLFVLLTIGFGIGICTTRVIGGVPYTSFIKAEQACKSSGSDVKFVYLDGDFECSNSLSGNISDVKEK